MLMIKKRQDFLYVQNKGRKIHTPSFLIIVHLSVADPPTQRLGLVVTKKVGNAVVRNRIKRVIRAVFADYKSVFPAHTDIVFIAKSSAWPISYAKVEEEIKRAKKRIQRSTDRS